MNDSLVLSLQAGFIRDNAEGLAGARDLFPEVTSKPSDRDKKSLSFTDDWCVANKVERKRSLGRKGLSIWLWFGASLKEIYTPLCPRWLFPTPVMVLRTS